MHFWGYMGVEGRRERERGWGGVVICLYLFAFFVSFFVSVSGALSSLFCVSLSGSAFVCISGYLFLSILSLSSSPSLCIYSPSFSIYQSIFPLYLSIFFSIYIWSRSLYQSIYIYLSISKYILPTNPSVYATPEVKSSKNSNNKIIYKIYVDRISM